MKRGEAPIYYWDTCVFYAMIKREENKPIESLNHIARMRNDAQEGKGKVVTSTLTWIELLDCHGESDLGEAIMNLKSERWVEFVDMNMSVAQVAKEIRQYYKRHALPNGAKSPKLADSIQLATAIVVKENFRSFDSLYTFDKVNKPGEAIGLVPLNGLVAGKYEIEIKEPDLEDGLLFEWPVLS